MNKIKEYVSAGNYFILFITLSIIIDNLSFSSIYFSLTDNIIFIIILAGVIIILYRLIIFILKDRRKSGLIFILLLCPVVYYDNIYKLLFGNSILTDLIDNKTRFLFIILTLFCLILIYKICKSKKIYPEITGFLNLLFLLSLLAVTINFIKNLEYNDFEKAIHIHSGYYQTGKLELLPDTSAKRDIYFLVFDSYTGFESLKKYWYYDNNELLTVLHNYHFSVYENARSNYDFTGFSIASTLNLNYFDSLLYSNNIDRAVTVSFMLIKKCCVTDFLVSKNYKIMNISPFDIADKGKYYYQNYYNSETSNIFRYFFNTTAMARIYNRFFIKKMSEVNLQSLAELNKTITDTIHPKFVYAHIMLPHDPYLFDKDGNLISKSEFHGEKRQTDKDLYFRQLQFTNKKIIESLNLIFSNPESDPVVIVQADHGFRYLDKTVYGQEENHSILFAVHLPGSTPAKNANDITGINLFRTIFNNYFGCKFPMLSHKEFFFTEYNK
jgi:hypothetical protein